MFEPTASVKGIFDILLVSSALFVIVYILGTGLVSRASRNPMVTLVMGFMLTLILWLAWLGISMIYQGFDPFQLSGTSITILGLLILIFMISAFRPDRGAQIVVHLFIGAWIFLIGLLAVVGLSAVTAWYVREYSMTYVLVALGVSLGLQVAIKYLTHRWERKHRNGPP